MQPPEKPFRKALQDLDGAKLALARMVTARNLDAREHEWRAFLNCIDKVLEKLTRGYKGTGGQLEPWLGSQVSAQRQDPLLLYLAKARDAEQHTIQGTWRPPRRGAAPGGPALSLATGRRKRRLAADSTARLTPAVARSRRVSRGG